MWIYNKFKIAITFLIFFLISFYISIKVMNSVKSCDTIDASNRTSDIVLDLDIVHERNNKWLIVDIKIK